MEEKSLAEKSRRVFGEPFVRALSDARFVEHPIRGVRIRLESLERRWKESLDPIGRKIRKAYHGGKRVGSSGRIASDRSAARARGDSPAVVV